MTISERRWNYEKLILTLEEEKRQADEAAHDTKRGPKGGSSVRRTPTPPRGSMEPPSSPEGYVTSTPTPPRRPGPQRR